MINGTSGDEPKGQDQNVTTWALGQWDRTLRLCVIRLTEALPAFAPLVWLFVRR